MSPKTRHDPPGRDLIPLLSSGAPRGCLTLFPPAGASVVLVVNNLGGLSCLELNIVAGAAVRHLGECLGGFLGHISLGLALLLLGTPPPR